MRTSRFRLPDLRRLLVLQYPVRCQACHQRNFAPLFSALKLPKAASAHPAARNLPDAPVAPQLKTPRTVRCYSCGSANLRTSRFQLPDLSRLLQLQYPIRCRSCRERSYRFLSLLWKLPKAAKANRIEEEIGNAQNSI
jgi:DNA-directed RNA polymerase subunit N (RpoN/RPB10)